MGARAVGILEDILSALERIPVWKRLQHLPGEVDGLQKRVSELEQKLGEKWPPEICKFCGARAARLANSYPVDSKGISREDWKCSECGRYEMRAHKAK